MTTRQQAIAQGDKWYTPTTKCPRCGTTSPRRVDNGECKGCQVGYTDNQLMTEAPEMVIERSQAVTLGIGVYRTGSACKYGHSGWRYVSNRRCVTCRRLDS